MRYRIAPISSLAIALSACTLSGCAAGPDYKMPAAQTLGVPESYSSGTATAPGAEELATWWKQLGDPALDGLIEKALANNLDIAQASARLRQAREALVQANAARLPNVSASGSAGRNYRSGTSGVQLDSNGNVIGTSSNRWSGTYSVGADASWQADLFGGLARSAEASRADYAASGYDLAAVRTAIISELVSNYIQARLAQEQLHIAREQLSYQQDNADIAGWRLQAGLVSSLDQEQARQQLAQTTATIPTFENSAKAALNRIAVLTGQAPGEATGALETPQPIPMAPYAIATGIPADTLRQRPDVRSAERALAAATARIGVAKAALYPSLGISGNLGTSATAFRNLTDIVTGGIFASLAQTIFDGGTRRSQLRSQRAAADAAFAAYKSSVLVAIEDVENAMNALSAARIRKGQFTIAQDAASNSAIMVRAQYRAGLTDFQDLLTAEQSLLSARNSLAGAQSDEVLAVAQLYGALGGGWQNMDETPQ
ncbi:efflux transporter outer membrane subunit [Sphingobium sp. H39-3-25]|uniref:efflux transporter outer membrane subunit n=1 Tax=Sphingobium arseniciresistens TaxID=3030834 RepID=UPI0023B901AF|nr:efflux transporter outer membrane subunit [Sphingobium arseniciresistens]